MNSGSGLTIGIRLITNRYRIKNKLLMLGVNTSRAKMNTRINLHTVASLFVEEPNDLFN